ncbi:protocadherin Fat 4 [Caerostris extrusa]|uniref:Protocadherin Fat 4 n=1 Tax=Caerostris extrusa TaxID=172846 RepID=A0AAV4SNS0_CAEEX|nr:protocadherin Fat 4 [Caerostris extrusa]
MTRTLFLQKEVYKTHVLEAAAITGARIRVKLSLDPPIHAYDQDVGVNAPLRYSIIQGNEKGLFEMHDQMADLYLVKEVDRESLKSPILTLHIQHETMIPQICHDPPPNGAATNPSLIHFWPSEESSLSLDAIQNHKSTAHLSFEPRR